MDDVVEVFVICTLKDVTVGGDVKCKFLLSLVQGMCSGCNTSHCCLSYVLQVLFSHLLVCG